MTWGVGLKSPSPRAKVIDFGDRFIIPGLIDTHGHLYTRTGREWTKTNPLLPAFFLAAGVTAVGDPGSMDFAGDVALREKIDSGVLPGPRLFLDSVNISRCLPSDPVDETH